MWDNQFVWCQQFHRRLPLACPLLGLLHNADPRLRFLDSGAHHSHRRPPLPRAHPTTSVLIIATLLRRRARLQLCRHAHPVSSPPPSPQYFGLNYNVLVLDLQFETV
jgi:hypothetical protein